LIALAVVPPRLPRNFAEMIVMFQFTPATPAALFALAPIVPDTCVPCESTALCVVPS
jgi:hypothetical protein